MGIRINKVEVVPISKKIDLFANLPTPSIFEWIDHTGVGTEDFQPTISRDVTPDGVEIVEWMIEAAEAMAALDVTTTSIQKAGGMVISKSGDPYIPGVSAGNLQVVSWRGETVKKNGYGVVKTPYGSFNVPLRATATYAMKDILAWAANLKAYTAQWVLALLSWVKLPTAPITNRIPFTNVQGFVAPQFVSVEPKAPIPIVVTRLGFTSNKEQDVVVKFRGSKGQYQNVLDETTLTIPAGQSEGIVWLTGVPFVSSFTIHVQPENNTKTVLDYVKVAP